MALYCILCLAAGYGLGRIDRIIELLRGETPAPSFLNTLSREAAQSRRTKIQIDEKKYVTDVSTDGLSSSTEATLGVVTKTSDDIIGAANKLNQLKRLKG